MISHVKGPFPPIPALAHPNWNSAVVRFTAPLALTRASCRIATTAAAILAAAVVIVSPAPSAAVESSSNLSEQQEESTTLSNIPQTLSGECAQPSDCKKARIQRPKSRKAESCTIKCVGTCIRGGDGSPGEGPLNIRRPIVVFKQGFRSRQYCHRSPIPSLSRWSLIPDATWSLISIGDP
ncbi:uncharacterized protein LOC111441457 isoform X1 [Cucurbita moschata]|uniref:Uncharacterized protein LOC111441457 isoform X1 n=1 Tax=Cucurbita moschata TaxID=3662 RepID=A0A6J1F186_CUCMO|nr:uncharacterized protein LOC111441457 isoform X1 [Cucurbita moschata]